MKKCLIILCILGWCTTQAQKRTYQTITVADVKHFGDAIKGVKVRLDAELILTKDSASSEYVVKRHTAVKVNNSKKELIVFKAKTHGVIESADPSQVTVKFDKKHQECVLIFVPGNSVDSVNRYSLGVYLETADEAELKVKETPSSYVLTNGGKYHYSTGNVSPMVLKKAAKNPKIKKIKAHGANPK